MRIFLVLPLLFGTVAFTSAQDRAASLPADVRIELLKAGFLDQDLKDLVQKDAYRSAHNGLQHLFLRQRWQGIEVWNGDIAIHRGANGQVVRVNNSARGFLAKQVNTTTPVVTAEQALTMVLARTLPGVPTPALIASEEGGHRLVFDGYNTSGTPITVQLYLVPREHDMRLAWNVNHYTPDGSHWWNIRIDAVTGQELDRNDWVSQCAFEHPDGPAHAHPSAAPMAPLAPAAPNDYHVYPWPSESPIHGPRVLVNAAWTDGGIASPFGWHDTDGSAGAEHTITKGNNVQAQEDVDANNTGGFSPDGGPTLDFDFPIDLAQAPSTYQSAAITNLFYWNNLMHDVWYQYGFDEVSGNFQQNNYARGGLGNDFVFADALDGSGTNNANFGTPPDGSNPRMQMFVWTAPTPDRTSDLDNGIIAHEYGHGISNRLVAGPSNVSCLSNSEQMGEGWSDYFGLMMTLKAGDVGPTARGIGTYVLGQPITGAGIRPAPYSTNTSVNDYTYANTNSGVSVPHGVGFVWCTMLWEMTWELIGVYGLDPDIYNGTGGNNLAMQLVIDGLKLTPCNPGFVDARDAILLADQLNNGGANQDHIWAAFARRGLGASADQGSSTSRSDQTEAFDLPVPNNVGVFAIVSPPTQIFDCPGTVPVTVQLRNSGGDPQSNFPVSYTVNGGAPVEETFTGTLAPGVTVPFTFSQQASLTGAGPFTVEVSTALATDQFAGNDALSRTVGLLTTITEVADYVQDVESGSTTPTGWNLENLDNGTTWTTTVLTNGALCASSRAWSINYYTYNAPGQEDRLLSPFIDLSASAGTRLKFHHAYAPYAPGFDDGLRVDVSVDCGTSWTSVFLQTGAALATTANSTSSWTPTNCDQWRLNDIDLSAYDGQTVLVRFSGINGYGNRLYLDNVAIESAGVRAAVKVILGGAYDPDMDQMRDDLRQAASFPLVEPYTGLGYAHAGGGGGETVDASVLAIAGADAIVDWVLLELRADNEPANVLATRSALLQRDGDVVDKDGVSTVVFATGAGNYHIAVRHRNHMGAMTAAPIALSLTPTTVDFTTAATATYGTNARVTLDGREVLWSGDVNNDGRVAYTGDLNDRDIILSTIGGTVPTNTLTGYHREDVNLDGSVKYTGEGNDRDPILSNIGGVVPTAVVLGTLP